MIDLQLNLSEGAIVHDYCGGLIIIENCNGMRLRSFSDGLTGTSRDVGELTSIYPRAGRNGVSKDTLRSKRIIDEA